MKAGLPSFAFDHHVARSVRDDNASRKPWADGECARLFQEIGNVVPRLRFASWIQVAEPKRGFTPLTCERRHVWANSRFTFAAPQRPLRFYNVN